MRHHCGNQLIGRRHWVHNGWELLVQQRQNTDGGWETDFVISGHNGEPQAVFNPQGELRWLAPRTNLWGRRDTDNTEKLDPGLAFAGQYRDAESGLCYNRFRYYEPSGCYISPDPISILGGENNYGYVHNSLGWVDPFGLASCPNMSYDDWIKSKAAQGNNTHVYIGYKNGKPIYVGISKDVDVRALQHGGRFDRLVPITETPLNRGHARSIEQALIDNNKSIFNNEINIISPTRKLYSDAVEWGENWLKDNGIRLKW